MVYSFFIFLSYLFISLSISLYISKINFSNLFIQVFPYWSSYIIGARGCYRIDEVKAQANNNAKPSK